MRLPDGAGSFIQRNFDCRCQSLRAVFLLDCCLIRVDTKAMFTLLGLLQCREACGGNTTASGVGSDRPGTRRNSNGLSLRGQRKQVVTLSPAMTAGMPSWFRRFQSNPCWLLNTSEGGGSCSCSPCSPHDHCVEFQHHVAGSLRELQLKPQLKSKLGISWWTTAVVSAELASGKDALLASSFFAGCSLMSSIMALTGTPMKMHVVMEKEKS